MIFAIGDSMGPYVYRFAPIEQLSGGPMKVDGLHHVTAITADSDANLAFYGRCSDCGWYGRE